MSDLEKIADILSEYYIPSSKVFTDKKLGYRRFLIEDVDLTDREIDEFKKKIKKTIGGRVEVYI